MGHSGGFVGFLLSAWVCYTTGKCGPDPPAQQDATSGFGGVPERWREKARQNDKAPFQEERNA